MSTASPESTATLLSSSTLAATQGGAERRPVRSVKHFPRFDFGRFGAESLSGASAVSGMQKSSSLPA
ncbi:gpt [Symbiodinium microadriaticum]|nr:gpt [Symbiodinium microadriaticum]